jgi:TrmH family RNA methyltransferase
MPMPSPVTSKSNARVKMLRASFSGAASRPGELVGIEGENLLSEAVGSRVTIGTVFVREGSEAELQRPALANLSAAHVVVLSRDVFASAVDTGSPQGIAAMIEIPEPEAAGTDGISLVLEALQDPGNLGTLLRSAEAFGIQRVFLTRDSVSAWNPKTVRASAGSVFRMPVVRSTLQEIAAQLQSAKVMAAVAHGTSAVSANELDWTTPCAILIGNEGAGLSPAALAMADVQVRIPCSVESLNASVAGAILMYEASVRDLRR